MPQIARNTTVVSLSLDRPTLKALDEIRKESGQTRSAAITTLILKSDLIREWRRLREIGKKTAQKMKITSEEDVYRILGDA